MKASHGKLWLLAALAALWAGCGHLDMAGEGNPERVLTGQLNSSDGGTLPPDAVVAVRVVNPERSTEKSPTAILGSPSTMSDGSAVPPKVLGEQIIHNPGSFPVSVRIEYTALDEELRRGLMIEARISYGGRVQYFNISGSAVTLGNFPDPHSVTVNRTR